MFNQKEYYKKWRLKNKKKMAAYMRKYRKEHPEYVKQQNEKNKTKKKRGGKERWVIVQFQNLGKR